SYSRMRHLLLSTVIVLTVTCNRWADYDILSAHGGVFRALQWTSQEVNHISALHARGEYHKLMHLIKEKLLDADDVSMADRRRIDRFLVAKRPPAVFRNLFDDDEKESIDISHSEGQVDDVLSIWSTALIRLSDQLRSIVIDYITT
ncbi:hypothetical protein PFISCL1PPCAC_19589, partial [Pristionchus fissidentatus]